MSPADSPTAYVVYIAGEDMGSIAGTDKNLASSMAQTVPILWVDPPISAVGQWRRRRRGELTEPAGLHYVSPGLTRLRVLGPPGVTRPLTRRLARRTLEHAIVSALHRLGATSSAVLLSNPIGRFPVAIPGRRVYYVTDDWSSGASMMGFSPRLVRRSMADNARRAHVVAAVSEPLASLVASAASVTAGVEVIPNGCTVPSGVGLVPPDLPTGSLVALVGQLNERLDYDILDAVAGTGLPLVVIGPRTERSSATARRLDSFLARPNVHWLGVRPQSSMPDYLRMMSVGITPYRLSAFNMASFPLKTLEYLASGLAVVTTDIPSARWLDSDQVVVTDSPSAFARRVVEIAAVQSDPESHLARRQLAAQHSWDERASAMRRLLSA